MNQNRKDQDVQSRRSNTEQAKGSGSVMDDKDTFEHGSGTSEVARGMGSSGERGRESGRSEERISDRQSGGGNSHRGRDQERAEQSRRPERGRAQSEE